MDFPTHFQHVFKQLNQQRLHAQLCDCVVAVGGQSFQAHRSILAACSSHFRALLSSSDSSGGKKAGADTGVAPTVMKLDPEVVTPEAFSTLLDMIYTSTLALGASNVMDVLLAASHLHLNAVVKACKLHLSGENFPSSPPKGWSSQTERLVTSVMEEEIGEEGVGVEVSQSVGFEDQGMMGGDVPGGQSPPSVRHKRKSHENLLSGRKRSRRQLEGNLEEGSPAVTRSAVSAEEERGDQSLSPDCLKTTNGLWDGRGEEEEKYEATKGESEEIQLPSQSDSSTGGAGAREKDRCTEDNTVLKVKVGEEGAGDGEEPKVEMIEVKTENQNSCSPDFDAVQNYFPSSPAQDHAEHLNTARPTEGDVGSLQSQACADPKSDPQREAGGSGAMGAETMDTDGEGLDSLSELTFSCLLNPDGEIGALGEEEDSLAKLTEAATAAAAAAASSGNPEADGREESQSAEARSSDSSASLLFPVSSVPLQQLLPPPVSAFSDALILHPSHGSLAGFLSGIRPGVCLGPSLVKPSGAGKSSASTTTFRRIAPKVPPGSEADAEAGDAADRPLLTRASDDVLSKCKKAAAEDHVLLVEGEKKYACKICCKTFMNLTDCKKHIRTHTGEKPYPCPKCGKCFSQSSHLYKHSKNACLNWRDDQSFSDGLL